MSGVNGTGIIQDLQKELTSEIAHTVNLTTHEKAGQLYDEAKNRLVDINHWHMWNNRVSARFTLFSQQGKKVQRTARQSDYFSIETIGAFPQTYLRVKDLEEERRPDGDVFTMWIDPIEGDDPDAKSGASDGSNFISISRIGRKVHVAYHYGTPFEKRSPVGSDKFVSEWKSLVYGVLEYKGL